VQVPHGARESGVAPQLRHKVGYPSGLPIRALAPAPEERGGAFPAPQRPTQSDRLWHLQATTPNKAQAAADHAWVDDWRRCLLDRVRRAVEKRHSRSRGSLSSTVLSVLVEGPLDDMTTLAARTGAPVGRPIRAEAFRKQVSRARCPFAELLVKEVARTLGHPTTE
jgi:hypothetical protein